MIVRSGQPSPSAIFSTDLASSRSSGVWIVTAGLVRSIPGTVSLGVLKGMGATANRTMEPRSSNTTAEPPSRFVATGSSGHLPRVMRRGSSAGPIVAIAIEVRR